MVTLFILSLYMFRLLFVAIGPVRFSATGPSYGITLPAHRLIACIAWDSADGFFL